MDWVKAVRGEGSFPSGPLPPVFLTLLLLSRFHNYGLNISFKELQDMDMTCLYQFFIIMDNLKPEDINIDAVKAGLGGIF